VSAGRLYLLPAPLSADTPPQDVVPAAVLERIRALDRFVAAARERGDVRFSGAGELADVVLGAA
jgi:hypothetical protein